MYSSNQNRERRLAAYLGIKWAGYSLRRFADHLGHDSVVVRVGGSRWGRLSSEKRFLKSVGAIGKNLIRNKRSKGN